MHRLIAPAFILLALALAPVAPAAAQSFTNLNFEAGNTSDAFSQAGVFPGWTFTPNVGAVFTFPHLSSLPQRYLASNSGIGSMPLSGNYSLAMQAGERPFDLDLNMISPTNIAIHQTAMVPAAAQSIILRATSPDPYHTFYVPGNPFPPEIDVYAQTDLAWQLSLGNGAHPLYRLPGGFWGMNIPGQAGQVRQLSIAMNEDYLPPNLYWPESLFDEISFSSQRIIPEPSSLALITLAAAVLEYRRRRTPPR